MTKYIFLNNGIPMIVNKMEFPKLTQLEIKYEFWKCWYMFSENEMYLADPIIIPKIGIIRRLIPAQFDNPIMECKFSWRNVGDYDVKFIIGRIKYEMLFDIDNIQNIYNNDEITNMLDSVKSKSELFEIISKINPNGKIRNY
jgi:hypothetical protein